MFENSCSETRCYMLLTIVRLLVVTALTLIITAALASAAILSQSESGAPARASRWWAHVEVLANDGMEGRNTGSPAHKRAADYVAEHFRQAGLEPVGDPASKSYI